MFKFLFLLLILPLTELFVFIEVGAEIGGLSVILLIIVTAFLGISFMRQQGMANMQRIQQGLATGQAPDNEILESLFIFIGGLFLLLPGFITDTIGLFFLIPFIRRFLVGSFRSHRTANRQGGNVFEAEWQENSETGSYIYTKVGNVSQEKVNKNDDIIEGEIIEPNDKK